MNFTHTAFVRALQCKPGSFHLKRGLKSYGPDKGQRGVLQWGSVADVSEAAVQAEADVAAQATKGGGSHCAHSVPPAHWSFLGATLRWRSVQKMARSEVKGAAEAEYGTYGNISTEAVWWCAVRSGSVMIVYECVVNKYYSWAFCLQR